ncbi:hypothetical protein LguiB_028558 [Lonicera macranthoides]
MALIVPTLSPLLGTEVLTKVEYIEHVDSTMVDIGRGRGMGTDLDLTHVLVRKSKPRGRGKGRGDERPIEKHVGAVYDGRPKRKRKKISLCVSDAMKKLKEYIDDLNVLTSEASAGVACDLNSLGFRVLCKATEQVVGHVKPYSITGSLPLIRDLHDESFDGQTTGYGLMATYHAKNEYCLLSEMYQGYQVFASIISQLEGDVP